MKFLFATSVASSLSLGFVIPFIAIFASENIRGGNIQVASLAAGVSPLVQGVFNLVGGKLLDRHSSKSELLPFYFFIIRQVTGVFYLLFIAFAVFPWHLYVIQSIHGVTSGLTMPAGSLIQSKYMDKDKEGFEWGVTTAVFNIFYGIGSILAGPLITYFGFQALFFTGAFFYFIASLAAWKTLNVYNASKNINHV